ncbi:hypothetical protein PHJA_000796600 [Phtheirospermum japonicum]|uniref:Uncharacterized protein n=1 Tax=Phtheirospermum japonicum TaxID=374723 RepID=A0A830BNI3_9LAMI|nr:hypothetical protein PHJA_000796600 [Phtheirospermum japonicum]
MGDALLELEQVLRSRKVPLTLQESNVMKAWPAQSVRDFTVGFGGGSVVTWLATQRLRSLFRINLALGAGVACGLWRFRRSVQSSVEHILSLEGSRIQRELGNIMLKRHHHNPWAMQHLSKHFYSEEVYDDSSVDRPTFRWRYRNFSGEPVNHYQSTYYGEETDLKENDTKNTTSEPKQVHVNTAGDVPGDPFDLIFGLSESAQNVAKPVELGPLLRKQRRKEKRSRPACLNMMFAVSMCSISSFMFSLYYMKIMTCFGIESHLYD